MSYFPPPTRQDLSITLRALLGLLNSHRLEPANREAIRRVIDLIASRYFNTDTNHQDLHP